MIPRAQFKEIWRLISRSLWIRPALYCIAATGVVWLATISDNILGRFYFYDVSQETIADLLGIIASSMLAVTIFAVSVMNAAYASAIRATTPRAFEIMVADSSTKQALSSFLGAFIFAVVGVIGLNENLYGQTGRAVMLVVTLGIFVWVVGTFVYWIDHVTQLGQMRHTLLRVASTAEKSLIDYLSRPVNQATPVAPEVVHDNKGHPITAGEGGVVKTLSVTQLVTLARDCDVEIDIALIAGDPVGPKDVLCYVSGSDPDKAFVRSVRNCFVIGYNRDPAQDPELSLRLLAEIADRALSPGVNDPGTAIDVLDALNRVFAKAFEESSRAEPADAEPRVRMPVIAPETFIRAAFAQIGRDGAGQIEVAERLQHSLCTLARSAPPEYQDAICDYARQAARCSEEALNNEWEIGRVRRAADWCQ